VGEYYYTNNIKNQTPFYKTYEIEIPLNINDQIIINNERFTIKQKFYTENGNIKYIISNKDNLIEDKESWEKIEEKYNVLCDKEDEKKKNKKEEKVVIEKIDNKKMLSENKIMKLFRRWFYFKK
jgi:hypothetical protein